MPLQGDEKVFYGNLIRTSINPVISMMRGTCPEEKARVLLSLNDAQRSVFLYQVMIGHANNGVAPFLLQISYLAERMDFWGALKSAMRFFEDRDMLIVIERLESAYGDVRLSLRPDQQMPELDALYQQALPDSLRLVCAYILSHPAEFEYTVSNRPAAEK